ncbi:M20 aminoacylase family protein [Rhizobium aegyptiacum]|uniref:M20 aminoacylase family protein n=1 Tax=Rhizobium aegyptiacum TaxID=1764550 RepID=UPI0007E59E53|nr:M20 aminoacylase family protein [Rhizobium aegyptiacum]
MTDDPVLHAIQGYEPEMVAIRRDIHAHPETGFEEFRTASLIGRTLEQFGIKTHVGIGKTGVVGVLKGTRPGQQAISLRADMDALLIDEKTDLPYQSRHAGKMHACGHDGHMAMLLSAARYLSEHRDFAGTVNFIFQPAEEGLGGARAMLEDGLFERFPADAIYGLHNQPGRAVGEFAIRPGPMLAASDRWSVTFRGTGGHGGGKVHLATDPTITLGHFILALQTIVGRNVPAVEPAVISIGHIAAGAPRVTNVIPSEIVVVGTARSFSPNVRDTLERRLGETAHGLAAVQGCLAEVNYRRGCPALVNHPEQTALAAEVAAILVGDEKVEAQTTMSTGGEDFAYMLQKKAGAFMRIGNGVGSDGHFHGLHTPHYDFNDAILSLGARYWVGLVERELGGEVV